MLSTARLLIVTGPGALGVQLKLQAFVPVAASRTSALNCASALNRGAASEGA